MGKHGLTRTDMVVVKGRRRVWLGWVCGGGWGWCAGGWIFWTARA